MTCTILVLDNLCPNLCPLRVYLEDLSEHFQVTVHLITFLKTYAQCFTHNPRGYRCVLQPPAIIIELFNSHFIDSIVDLSQNAFKEATFNGLSAR